MLEGPGTRTYVRAPYRISFRYPVHSPRQLASWYPNGPCITRGPNRWTGALTSIHVIYYMLLLIGESRSMRTLFATTPHETIPSRLPHNLPRTTFKKQFLHITVDSLNTFVRFCWSLQTNCMSNPYATNTLATGRPLLGTYWVISTLHTLTFPPPRYRTITRDSELPTTSISRSKP